MFGARMTVHWPFQLGYFASSAARAVSTDMIRAAVNATATTPIELWLVMVSSSDGYDKNDITPSPQEPCCGTSGAMLPES